MADTICERVESCVGLRLAVCEQGAEAGHAFLYVLSNDLHNRPFGFMEDVWIAPAYRGKGLGTRLVSDVIALAREQGCYKLICTARNTKPEVQRMYEKFGFVNHGKEFRMDMD